MKAEDILLALGEIDETLPAQCVQSVKKKPNPWKSILVAAACIAVVLISVVTVKKINISPMTALPTESETGYIPASESCSATPDVPALPEESSVTEAALSQVQGQAQIPVQTTTQAPAADTTSSAPGGATTCAHQWIAGDCTTPRTCSICGATTGSPNKHNYAAATCDKPQTCRSCGATTGSPLGHDYAASGYCKRCHKTRAGKTDPSYVPSAKPLSATTTKSSETETTTATTTSTTAPTPAGDDVTLSPDNPIASPPIDGDAPDTTAPQTEWSQKPVRDKYPEMRYNGKTYSYYGASGQQDAEQSLDTCTLQGSDGKPEHAVTVEVYALSEVSPETEVLVRFPDGGYYRYK